MTDKENRMRADCPVSPRRLLFIAYYFPPDASSGVYRAVNVVRHLPSYGWIPTVLTIGTSDIAADARVDPALLQRIARTVRIARARVVKLVRHWPFPDDKLGWLPAALWVGWRISRRQKLDAVLATGGPWSSLLIAYLLTRIIRVPLILDFRDPWARNPYRFVRPSRLRLALERRLERVIVRAAAGVVANTPALRAAFLEDYPDLPPDRFVTITNGYEPSLASRETTVPPDPRCLTITHTGHVYARRSPDALFDALSLLSADRRQDDIRLRVRFIGSSDVDLNAMIRARALDHIVEVIPPISHEAAVGALYSSDLLLLLQSGTQLQIPAKLYEYMATGRPILALTDSGSIASMVTDHDLGWVCAPDSAPAISALVSRLIELKRSDELRPRLAPSDFRVDRLVERLAAFCDVVTASRQTDPAEALPLERTAR